MKLAYLPTNQLWVFTFGDAIIRFASSDHAFYETRAHAVADARKYGLGVDLNNDVMVLA
jgi:hypothetical protein